MPPCSLYFAIFGSLIACNTWQPGAIGGGPNPACDRNASVFDGDPKPRNGHPDAADDGSAPIAVNLTAIATFSAANAGAAHREYSAHFTHIYTNTIARKDNPATRWRNPRSTKHEHPRPIDAGGRPGVPVDVSDRALIPADVIEVSRKNALGNRRCYEHALEKDPFLDVNSIKVALTVTPSGVVSKLELSSYANTFLGQCLQTRIRKWAFRKSPTGITTQLTLSFEQS